MFDKTKRWIKKHRKGIIIRQIVVHEDIDADHVRHIRLEIHFNFQPIPAVDQYDPADQRPYLHPDHSDRYVMAQ